MVKLKIGQCACTKRGRVYCRKRVGYRFKSTTCSVKYRGKKLPKKRRR